ncbi:MAG: hypothetical protein OXE99_11485 [Cellvibrionales bacterium]|nr:hypothetical protein [Cellvibrionales bacterium]
MKKVIDVALLPLYCCAMGLYGYNILSGFWNNSAYFEFTVYFIISVGIGTYVFRRFYSLNAPEVKQDAKDELD